MLYTGIGLLIPTLSTVFASQRPPFLVSFSMILTYQSPHGIKEVGDRHKLIILHSVHEVADGRRSSLLILCISKIVCAALWVSIFQRNWNVFTCKTVWRFVFRNHGQPRIFCIDDILHVILHT